MPSVNEKTNFHANSESLFNNLPVLGKQLILGVDWRQWISSTNTKIHVLKSIMNEDNRTLIRLLDGILFELTIYEMLKNSTYYTVLKGLTPRICSCVPVLQNNAQTMADVITSSWTAKQTVTNDSSLLGELRQDRHAAELEAELKELRRQSRECLLVPSSHQLLRWGSASTASY